ncbi:hypothetical protein KKKH38_14700 [Helicobacter pylori]
MQQFNNLDKFLENMFNAIPTKHDKIPGKFKLLYQTIIDYDTTNEPFYNALIGLGLFLYEDSYEYTKNDNPIYVVKRILDGYKYKPGEVPNNELREVLQRNIKSAIKDIKNPKDYPYINLKELSDLKDSILIADSFFKKAEYKDFEEGYDYVVSKKGLQSLAKLKSMWSSVGKFYFAYLKETILRHAKEITDKLISSEEKSIKANQVKLTEATQGIDKMEKIIKNLESKKSTLSVDLKFGKSFTAHYKCQNLIEVKVKTNKGSWTFNFNR